MNDVLREFWNLRSAIAVGVVMYAVFLLAMYALRKRKGISWRYLAELTFCVYGASLLNLTGIFSMQYSLVGIKSYNLVPFIGSAFAPVMLNFSYSFHTAFCCRLFLRRENGLGKRCYISAQQPRSV